MAEVKFEYSTETGRPQILLIGNGLEYESGQPSWEQILKNLNINGSVDPAEKSTKAMPFPLLYQLLATPIPAPAHLSAEDIREEETRLARELKAMVHCSNRTMDLLPSVNADHIMTTNYSYCTESAFFPGTDFCKPKARSACRFYLKTDPKTHEPVREQVYRLHTGYLAQSEARQTGIWHIHGEYSNPRGIVLGHDRYGRLLMRIAQICGKQDYSSAAVTASVHRYTSWPELILHGDVYVLGLGLEPQEFDLWWLLRRKQRERHFGGNVFFYEREPKDGFTDLKHLLLQAHGVTLRSAGCTQDTPFSEFYAAALADIQRKMEEARA